MEPYEETLPKLISFYAMHSYKASRVIRQTMTFDKKVKQLEFWSYPLNELEHQFQTSIKNGLTSEDAESRLSSYGKNTLKSKKKSNLLFLWASQFKSPIILIFIFTSLLSLFLGQLEDAALIITIIIISGILGFWQERGAINAVDKLLEFVQARILVLRDEDQYVHTFYRYRSR